MERPHYEDEDSNPLNNGWIKKEIDDDDFEEYMKHEQEEEDHSADRYEELMGLPKEDLIGRILQQEEDIRYLQDIRHGLEKNVQGLSSSCEQFKKLLEVMAATVNSLKGVQAIMGPSGTTASLNSNRPTVTMPQTPMPPRTGVNTPSSQPSPRATPVPSVNVPTSNASPRSTPNIQSQTANLKAMGGSASNMPTSHMTTTSVMSNDRLPSGTSMSSHQTVTITRQTNVIIKTEIPSPPPPEAMTTNTSPMSSATMTTSTMPHTNQKSRVEPPSFFPIRQQQQQQQQQQHQQPKQAMNTQKPYMPTSSRSITDIVNSIPTPRQRTRPNPAMFQPNVNMQMRSMNQANKGNTQQFPMQRQVAGHHSGVTPARGRGRGHNVNQRSAPYTTQKPGNPNSAPAMGRGRIAPKQNPQPQNAANTPPSGVNNLLANLKMPSGITLSLVQAKQPQPGADKAASSPLVRALPLEGNRSDDGGHLTKSDKMMLNSQVNNFPDDDDEEEDYFDEIAVLIPDKKGVSGGENQGQVEKSKNNVLIAQEVLSDSHSDSGGSYWNAESLGQKQSQQTYQNNAEYMFEEAEDLDSDENDAKVYIGENVTIPNDLLENCIKQGPNPTKLTRNLMRALFPDLRELANGYSEAEANPPLLPANKVKAIIGLVQKSFPQVKRGAIMSAMNGKCKEAKAMVSRAGASQQQNF